MTETITLSVKSGDFTVRHGSTGTTANLHNLTQAQFDALVDAFGTTDPDSYRTNILRTDAGKRFRSCQISLGGLPLSLFADVPAEGVLDKLD